MRDLGWATCVTLTGHTIVDFIRWCRRAGDDPHSGSHSDMAIRKEERLFNLLNNPRLINVCTVRQGTLYGLHFVNPYTYLITCFSGSLLDDQRFHVLYGYNGRKMFPFKGLFLQSPLVVPQRLSTSRICTSDSGVVAAKVYS